MKRYRILWSGHLELWAAKGDIKILRECISSRLGQELANVYINGQTVDILGFVSYFISGAYFLFLFFPKESLKT